MSYEKCWCLKCSREATTQIKGQNDDFTVTVCDHHGDRLTSVGPWVLSESPSNFTGQEEA